MRQPLSSSIDLTGEQPSSKAMRTSTSSSNEIISDVCGAGSPEALAEHESFFDMEFLTTRHDTHIDSGDNVPPLPTPQSLPPTISSFNGDPFFLPKHSSTPPRPMTSRTRSDSAAVSSGDRQQRILTSEALRLADQLISTYQIGVLLEILPQDQAIESQLHQARHFFQVKAEPETEQ